MFLPSMSLCMSLGMSVKGMSLSMFIRGTYTVILLKCNIDRPFSHTHIAQYVAIALYCNLHAKGMSVSMFLKGMNMQTMCYYSITLLQ